jgi:NADPH:quinone reductase-like Zn-dependent oxidoreductase
MYLWQCLPPPWSPCTSSSRPLPFIIYGASSALGAFSAKFAKASNIHPIIAIGGGSKGYVTSLLDKRRGDTWIDYRQDVESMKREVKEALGDTAAFHAVDCISDKGTWIPVAQMLTSGGQVSVFTGSNLYDEIEIPSGVTIKYTYVGSAHSGAYLPMMPKQPNPEVVESAPEFTHVLFRYMSRMLLKGTLEGHPYEVIPGGLNGVASGLQRLKNGEARGKKFIYRIGDTE